MIRLTLLTLFVVAVGAYAWRDWFKSLCGLILLMAVVEHPDMPKSLLGIQGLNVWNLLLADIALAWAVARRRERLRWDLSRPVVTLLALYLVVVVTAFVRLLLARDNLTEDHTLASLVSEYLVNCVKWVIPGLLLYDGCRSRSRFVWALTCTLAVYVLLAVQVIKWMPLRSGLSGEDLEQRSAKILVKEVGYHRVNLSMILAGGSWAIFAARGLAPRGWQFAGVMGASAIVVFGQALTAGRTGYATWAAVGFVLCAARWRRYLLLAPIAVWLVILLVPAARDRLLQGFNQETDFQDESSVDAYEVTAGRTLIWPFVIEKIKERPFVGHGRLAMKTTGLTDFLLSTMNEAFPHPHNAYLEMLLDNGWLGMVLVLPFYLLVLWKAMSLFLDSRSPIFVAIGGAALALVLALLVAGAGSQTFYPREGSVGMWCVIGLLLRVSRERVRALARQDAAARPPSRRERPAAASRPAAVDELLWAS